VTASTRTKYSDQTFTESGLYGKTLSVRYENNAGRLQDVVGRAERCPGAEESGFLLHEVEGFAERGHWLPWGRLVRATVQLWPGQVEVGDGVTEPVGSDRYAGTVTWVSGSGKTLRYTTDEATPSGPVHDREQYAYTYQSTPVRHFTDVSTGKRTSNEHTARWSAKRQRFVVTGGGRGLSAGRHAFQDPSF
jgi:hypothetical protein